MVFLTLKKGSGSWKKKQNAHVPTNGDLPVCQLPRLPWPDPKDWQHIARQLLEYSEDRVRGVPGEGPSAVYPFFWFGFKEKMGACIWGGQNPFILKKGMTSNMELNKYMYKGHWDKWTRWWPFQLSTLSGKLFLCRLGVKNCSIFFWTFMWLNRFIWSEHVYVWMYCNYIDVCKDSQWIIESSRSVFPWSMLYVAMKLSLLKTNSGEFVEMNRNHRTLLVPSHPCMRVRYAGFCHPVTGWKLLTFHKTHDRYIARVGTTVDTEFVLRFLNPYEITRNKMNLFDPFWRRAD